MKTTDQQTAHETGISNIYESKEFYFLKDYSMHPGGLRLTDRAVRLAGLHTGMKAADMGCGAGSTAAYLTNKYGLIMTGLEISEPLIRIGITKNPGLNLILHDCITLPFKTHSLEAVLFECSLSVMGFKDIILDECATVLKNNGKLIISDLFSKQEARNPFVLPTFIGLESRLAAKGFIVEVSEDHTPALITYGAELSNHFGKGCDAGRFVCSRFAKGFKMSDHCYHLIIARKMKE